jgi:hypothetical protein
VDLDPFANAILRGGRVSDTVFDYDSVPIPQGLIAEPGGNVDGAQLPTTGIASTNVTLAGYFNESDNALGGVVNQIPAVRTYPGSTTIELADGIGPKSQFSSLQMLGATPDLKWRYALASTFGNDYLKYGYGNTFYAAEAATYGLSLQTRGGQYSIESNVHYAATAKDDISILALVGQAEYNRYGSPYSGETIGQFDGATSTYPGETNPNTPVNFASRGYYDIIKGQWQHTGSHIYSRVQVYQSQFGSSSAPVLGREWLSPMGRSRSSKRAISVRTASILTTKPCSASTDSASAPNTARTRPISIKSFRPPMSSSLPIQRSIRTLRIWATRGRSETGSRCPVRHGQRTHTSSRLPVSLTIPARSTRIWVRRIGWARSTRCGQTSITSTSHPRLWRPTGSIPPTSMQMAIRRGS